MEWIKVNEDENKETKVISVSNSTYFYCNCTYDQMTIINRMAQAVIAERCGVDAPIWEKEEVIDQWLKEPFDSAAFARASIDRSDGSRSLNSNAEAPLYRRGHKLA